MRRLVAIASIGVLAGCASQAPPPRVVLHRSERPAPAVAVKRSPPVTAATPVKVVPPAPVSDGPGANVPLEGFRPMRGQTRSGA